VILPAQLSVAVGGITVTEQLPVTTGRDAASGTGAVVSLTVKVVLQVALLPD
jgi:hypothetical protein